MRVKFIIVCLVGLILFAGYYSIEPNKKSTLTINDVKRAFANTGLELIPDKDTIQKDFLINGVKPTIFKMDQYFDDRLFVYVFKSSEEREKGRNVYSNNISPFQAYLSEEISWPCDFATKNVVLIYTSKDTIRRYSKRMEDVLVNQLNEGEFLSFEGKGEYWVATYKYNFYSNSDKKEESSFSDNYCIEEATVSYIGERPESIGRINYKLESQLHGHYGNDAFIPRDGKLYFAGGASAVDELPDKNELIKFSVGWKDKEEYFELKLKD